MMSIIWIIIAVVAVVIDLITSSFFFFMFAIGAIIAAICSLLHMPFVFQMIIFTVISVALISGLYPLLKKKFKVSTKSVMTMEEKYVGMKFIAENDIVKNAQLKVKGEYWTVVNNGSVIHKGDEFSIVGIEGIKLIIKKNEEE